MYHTILSDGQYYESTNPIDIIIRDNYDQYIWIDNSGVNWCHPFKALAQAARIELFQYAHLAPIDMDKFTLNYLRYGRRSLNLETALRGCIGGDGFYSLLRDVYFGEASMQRPILVRIFEKKRRENSALDLHIQACFLVENKNLKYKNSSEVIKFYESLGDNPIKDYVMRILLCVHKNRTVLKRNGFLLKPKLGGS